VQKYVGGCSVKIYLTFMRTGHFPSGFEIWKYQHFQNTVKYEHQCFITNTGRV